MFPPGFAVYITLGRIKTIVHIMPSKITPTLLFTAVVALWLATLCVLVLVLPDWGSRGQFGDLFGSVNALFSGLAFAALYSSIRVQQSQLETQQNELALQREELKLQREEMAASRGELANQVRVQQAQFEASVAQILVAQAQARIEAIKMESEQVTPSGRRIYVLQIEDIAKSLTALSDRVKELAKSAA
jgi:hypothetical protein